MVLVDLSTPPTTGRYSAAVGDAAPVFCNDIGELAKQVKNAICVGQHVDLQVYPHVHGEYRSDGRPLSEIELAAILSCLIQPS
jgi:hypothetical protein